MTEDDARELAKTPKKGDPAEWCQDRPNTYTNTFGVTDKDGIGINHLHVEFTVFISPNLGLTKYVFSLMYVEFNCRQRAYQMEINLRTGLKITDLNYSHEHYGDSLRIVADESWAYAGFRDAIKLFCDKCSLTLENELPDYSGFALK